MRGDQFIVEWEDGHREPKCPPNPAYPEGIDVVVSEDSKMNCTVQLSYPAKRCGIYIVRCKVCDFSVALTTAGRVDDPRSVTIPCKITSVQ